MFVTKIPHSPILCPKFKVTGSQVLIFGMGTSAETYKMNGQTVSLHVNNDLPYVSNTYFGHASYTRKTFHNMSKIKLD